MELGSLRTYLLKKKGAYEDYPFGPEIMVFKVMAKMFALVSPEASPIWMNLKCDPDLARHLRGYYKAVLPGYHMNKRHWNTITLDGSIPDEEIFTMIDDSYDAVVKGLKRAVKEKLSRLNDH